LVRHFKIFGVFVFYKPDNKPFIKCSKPNIAFDAQNTNYLEVVILRGLFLIVTAG